MLIQASDVISCPRLPYRLYVAYSRAYSHQVAQPNTHPLFSQVVTLSALAIIILAPTSAILIPLTAPHLLKKSRDEQLQTVHTDDAEDPRHAPQRLK